MKHLTAKPDVSMLAEPYRSVVARALEKDPEKRYRSVGEMLAALPGGCPNFRPGENGTVPLDAPKTSAVASSVNEGSILRTVREHLRKLLAARNRAGPRGHVGILLFLVVLYAIVFHADEPVVIPLMVILGIYVVLRMLRDAASTSSGRPPAVDSTITAADSAPDAATQPAPAHAAPAPAASGPAMTNHPCPR